MSVTVSLSKEWFDRNVLFEEFEVAQKNLSRDFPEYILSINTAGSGYIFNSKGSVVCRITNSSVEFK